MCVLGRGNSRNRSFCNLNGIIRAQTHQIVLSYSTALSPYLIFTFFTLYDVTDGVTGVILGHKRFFFCQQLTIELRESRKAPVC